MKQLERAIEKVSNIFFPSIRRCLFFKFFFLLLQKLLNILLIIHVYAVKMFKKVMLSNGAQ